MNEKESQVIIPIEISYFLWFYIKRKQFRFGFVVWRPLLWVPTSLSHPIKYGEN